MGKTGHINLSNQELRYFVEANSRLTTLTNEANYLNGNLREENSRTKEDARTALGQQFLMRMFSISKTLT